MELLIPKPLYANQVALSTCGAYTPVMTLDFPCHTGLGLPACCLGRIYTAFPNAECARSLKSSNLRVPRVSSNPVCCATDLADLSKSLP